MLNEAMRWTAAIQGVIDSKTPIETPTLQLIRDIKVDFIPASSLDSSLLSLTLLFFRVPSGEQREPRNCRADVQEEPHPQIHPAPSTLAFAAPPLWRGHQL